MLSYFFSIKMHDHQHLDNFNERFPEHLDVREVGEGKWKLLHDYVYHDVEVGEIVVPEGFVTDLYSIPRVVRTIVSAIQNSNGPAVVHDWLYRAQTFGPHGQHCADQVLQRAMRDHWCPVSLWTRWKIMAGLKLGGFLTYRKHAERLADFVFMLGGRTPTTHELTDHL